MTDEYDVEAFEYQDWPRSYRGDQYREIVEHVEEADMDRPFAMLLGEDLDEQERKAVRGSLYYNYRYWDFKVKTRFRYEDGAGWWLHVTKYRPDENHA